jgi:hypothetical protein
MDICIKGLILDRLVNLISRNVSAGLLLGVALLASSIIVSAIISYRISDAPRSWCGFWHHVLPPGSLRHPSGRADIMFFGSYRKAC